ncbi:MAG: hypothetical protein RL148_959 [Planctomycetota bacterium]
MNAIPRARQQGFTLLELVVVMGILAGFLAMLVQLLDMGITLVGTGESAQVMADRGDAVARTVERDLRRLRGPLPSLEPTASQPRMLLQQLPLGLPARTGAADTRAFSLRSSAWLTPEEEMPLREGMIMQQARALADSDEPGNVAEKYQELLAVNPPRGMGVVWLLAWPQGDPDGALVELRRGTFLDNQLLDAGPGNAADPLQVAFPGGPELPSSVVLQNTATVARDVLHVELLCWSQRTRSWTAVGDDGPERTWDSARAGWHTDAAAGPVFRLDRGPESLLDSTDDVFPRALRVVLVVAQDARQSPEGILAEELSNDATSLRLVGPDRFPGAEDGGYVKVGREWIRYARMEGARLEGLQRGQRGTARASHAQGAVLRVGRTVEFTLPLSIGRDDWNG